MMAALRCGRLKQRIYNQRLSNKTNEENISAK